MVLPKSSSQMIEKELYQLEPARTAHMRGQRLRWVFSFSRVVSSWRLPARRVPEQYGMPHHILVGSELVDRITRTPDDHSGALNQRVCDLRLSGSIRSDVWRPVSSTCSCLVFTCLVSLFFTRSRSVMRKRSTILPLLH